MNNFIDNTSGAAHVWVPCTTLDTACGSDTGTVLGLTFNTTWSFLNNYYEWPKGVSDASFEQKYKPKWHIELGYKNQMDSMWN